jgi:hypothetical protein
VSFATIGAVWLEHTVITEYLDQATSVLIRLNLLGWFFPLPAVLGYLAIAVYIILPFRTLRRRKPVTGT